MTNQNRRAEVFGTIVAAVGIAGLLVLPIVASIYDVCR